MNEVTNIHLNAVYTLEEAREALALANGTLAREYKLGRLRVSKRAGRHYILGEWLLEWIRSGEAKYESNLAEPDVTKRKILPI